VSSIIDFAPYHKEVAVLKGKAYEIYLKIQVLKQNELGSQEQEKIKAAIDHLQIQKETHLKLFQAKLQENVNKPDISQIINGLIEEIASISLPDSRAF